MRFYVSQHSRFDAAVGEIKARILVCFKPEAVTPIPVLNLRGRKFQRGRVPVKRELVDDRTPRISQAQELRDLVECFTGSIISGVPDVLIEPALRPLRGQVQVRMATG